MCLSLRKLARCFACFLLIWLAPLHAQKVTSTIRGTVTDPSGAAIPGTDVTVKNEQTNLTRSVKSNADGEFVVPDLEPGNYDVTVKKANFKEFVSRGVQLFVSSTAVINASLEVGSATEMVTVEANPVQVETTSGAVGNVVEGRRFSSGILRFQE